MKPLFVCDSKPSATGWAGLSAPPEANTYKVQVRLEMISDMECGGCRSWLPSCRFQVGAVAGALTTWRVGPAQLRPADDKKDLRRVSQCFAIISSLLFQRLPLSAPPWRLSLRIRDFMGAGSRLGVAPLSGLMLTHGNCTPPQGFVLCGVPLVFACFFHSAISDCENRVSGALFCVVRRFGVDGNVSWVSFLPQGNTWHRRERQRDYRDDN
jgi:hypothetical protein